MSQQADILIFGSGSFAERIAFDAAATAADAVTIVIAARNAERLAWLRTAANARAAIFGSPCKILTQIADLENNDATATVLSQYRPAVVIQAASSQPSSVIAQNSDAWGQLVAMCGLSTTALFQTVLTLRVARAIAATSPNSLLINCCFPDVVNGLISAAGLHVLCGTGNIAILSNAFGGQREIAERRNLKVLAHYQNLAAWRKPQGERRGATARVWIEDREVMDVFAAFADVQLTPQPVIEISGASTVPLALAIARHLEWRGHAPGPNGLPGGYPVIYRGGAMRLDLPAGLSEAEAIRWNAQFEENNGLIVRDGKVQFTGILRDQLKRFVPDLAAGFPIGDVEQATVEMAHLRERLRGMSSAA